MEGEREERGGGATGSSSSSSSSSFDPDPVFCAYRIGKQEVAEFFLFHEALKLAPLHIAEQRLQGSLLLLLSSLSSKVFLAV